MHSIWQDFRYGLRQLFKDPVFTFVAAISLALGIGANAAIFQLVNAIRLKSLPVRAPQELVTVDFAKKSSLGGNWSSRSAHLTYMQFDQIRQNQQGFTGVIAWSADRMNLAHGGEPIYAEGLYVTGNFFQELGVSPAIGRFFTPQEDTLASCSPAAVLSYAYWQRQYGGEPSVLGRTISLNTHPYPIIGVAASTFFGVEVGNRFDVAIPVCADRIMAEDKKGRIPVLRDFWLSAMARLKPGWTPERATAQLQAVSPGIMKVTVPPEYKTHQVSNYLKNKLEATPAAIGVSGLRQQYERTLWVLMATTGLVLLIACANLANLLLARASIREGEIAVRLAIGASRWRLVRQLLAESLLLAALGTALGIGLAQVLTRGLVSFLNTADNPIFIGMGLDWRLIGFTAGIAVFTCILFGLAPALRATDLSPVAAIRAGGRSLTAGRERFALRRILMVAQVAFSLVLLVGALLFIQSLHNLMTTDSGFKPEGVLTVSVDYTGFPKDRWATLNREVMQRLSTRVGAVSAAQLDMLPVSGNGWNSDVGPDGSVAAASGKEAFFNRVGPGYFQTMGSTILAGRDFTDADNISSPKVGIVNQEFARKYFGGKNPVGRTFHMSSSAGKPEPLIQVVGLVQNSKYYDLSEEFKPICVFPTGQNDEPGSGSNFVVRVAGSPTSIVNGIKASVAEISPEIGIEFHSFSKQLEDSVLRERLMAALSGAFGILAVVLATVGLYGVISYLVTRRRTEIGIRIALGANHGRVILLVLREAMLLLTVGLGVGVLLSLWAGAAAATLLYGLKPYDPVSLVAASALLAAIALAASYIPASRAAALQPMVALRDE
jgi:predicted permease